MPTKILSIQPRLQNFRTQTNADWLDGLLVYQAGSGGVVAGATNVGNGALSVASVSPSSAFGVHVVSVTSVDNSPRITVQDPTGAVTARGVVGLPLFASGITFTLSSGSTAFAVDDTFFISILPVPIDISGIDFDLHMRQTRSDPNVRLAATSHPADGSLPTMVLGGSGGQVALRVLHPALSSNQVPPGEYVYDILASADDLQVVAFFGTVTHVTGSTFLP